MEYIIKYTYPNIKGKQPKELSIQSDDLYYTELANLDGVQCGKVGMKQEEIKLKCRKVVKLIREIHKLNNNLPF